MLGRDKEERERARLGSKWGLGPLKIEQITVERDLEVKFRLAVHTI